MKCWANALCCGWLCPRGLLYRWKMRLQIRMAHFLAFHHGHCCRSSTSPGCASRGRAMEMTAPSTAIQPWNTSPCCRLGGMSMYTQLHRDLRTSLRSSGTWVTTSPGQPGPTPPALATDASSRVAMPCRDGREAAQMACSSGLDAASLYSYLRHSTRSTASAPDTRATSGDCSAVSTLGSRSGQASG